MDIGLKMGLVRYDRRIPFVYFSSSWFPFTLPWVARLPVQLLESIVCTALLYATF